MILENLPEGYEETMQHGMPSYVVPFARYPTTYNGQPLAVASLASQKRYMSLYLMGLFFDEPRTKAFASAWKKTGKPLDMGKACLRFSRVEDLSLDVIGDEVAALPIPGFLRSCEALMARLRKK